MRIGIFSTENTNNSNKTKEYIINELIKKTDYTKAYEYAKKNIGVISEHRHAFFDKCLNYFDNKSMTESLQCTILHLANLKFGFVRHYIEDLSDVFKSLLSKDPDEKEEALLISSTSLENVRKKYDYDNVINNIIKSNTITFANNDKFLGKIKNGLYDNGTLVHNKSGVKFKGKFPPYGIDGSKEIKYSDGGIYEGQWFCDKRHGNGKYTYPSGETYEGQWKNNILISINENYHLSNFMWNIFKIRIGQLNGGLFGAANVFFKNIFKNINESSLYDKNFKKFIKDIESKVEEIHKNLLSPKDLRNKLDNLKNDQSLVFEPMLYNHCVILECTLISNNKVKLSIYNSGDGITDNHEVKDFIHKTKYQLRKNFIFDKTKFTQQIIPLINKETKVDEFYKALTLNSEKNNSIHLLNKTIWQKPQVNGSCSIEAYMAYFKNLGGDILYNQFQLQMLDILKNKYYIDNNKLLMLELTNRYEKIKKKIENHQIIHRSSEHV